MKILLGGPAQIETDGPVHVVVISGQGSLEIRHLKTRRKQLEEHVYAGKSCVVPNPATLSVGLTQGAALCLQIEPR